MALLRLSFDLQEESFAFDDLLDDIYYDKYPWLGVETSQAFSFTGPIYHFSFEHDYISEVADILSDIYVADNYDLALKQGYLTHQQKLKIAKIASQNQWELKGFPEANPCLPCMAPLLLNPKPTTGLARTMKQIENKIDSKVNAVVLMKPEDFLFLTALFEAPSEIRGHIDEIMEDERTIEDFNSKPAAISPRLTIKIDKKDHRKGQVVGHEGRHRMGALIREGYDLAEIDIKLVDENFVGSRKYNALDIPVFIESQWSSHPFYEKKIFDSREIHEVLEANVQEDYQKNPEIENITISHEEWKEIQDGK